MPAAFTWPFVPDKWHDFPERKLQLDDATSILIGIFLLTALTTRAAGQAKPSAIVTSRAHSLVEGTFHSKSLQRDMRYRVLLPRGYEAGTKRFAVLYLLHGLDGDYTDWTTNSKVQDYAQPLPLIIVMPDADDSWYANSATVPADKFEDYIVKDLVAEIDARFRTRASRSGRAVAGLSMGGYGALKFALKYPGMFAFAGSLSGALDAPIHLDERVPEYREKLLAAFGPHGNPAHSANDLFQLVARADAAHLPYLYVACGAEDGFLPINREFVSSLPSRKIAFEYHETPGGHSWDYWDRSVRDLLRSAAKAIDLR